MTRTLAPNPSRSAPATRRNRGIGRPLQYLALTAHVVFLGFPLLFLLTTAVKTPRELQSPNPSFLPVSVTQPGTDVLPGFLAASTRSMSAATSSPSRSPSPRPPVVPPESRFAAAITFGADLGTQSTEDALDAIHDRYGHLHWVHVLNNAAVLAYALVRGEGDYAAAITTAVTGGWDTDSVGATAGSLAGALTGAAALPGQWIDPLRNRLASSVPGFDGIGFDAMTARTVAR